MFTIICFISFPKAEWFHRNFLKFYYARKACISLQLCLFAARIISINYAKSVYAYLYLLFALLFLSLSNARGLVRRLLQWPSASAPWQFLIAKSSINNKQTTFVVFFEQSGKWNGCYNEFCLVLLCQTHTPNFRVHPNRYLTVRITWGECNRLFGVCGTKRNQWQTYQDDNFRCLIKR